MTTIAVLSDSHDQIANLRTAVQIANDANADILLHCGDLISPFMLETLALFRGPVHLIFGNNSGDRNLIKERCTTRHQGISHHGEQAFFSFCDLNIAMVHYPKEAKELASTGNYDLVCFGHSHRFETAMYQDTLLINPGHLLGENHEGGCALVRFPQKTVERIVIDGCMFDHEISVTRHNPEQPGPQPQDDRQISLHISTSLNLQNKDHDRFDTGQL